MAIHQFFAKTCRCACSRGAALWARWLLVCALATPSLALAQTPTPEALMDWAEGAYAALFPEHQTTRTGDGFVYRHYPATSSFLGVKSDGGVYVLLPSTDNQVRYVAALADFTCLVTPKASTCLPPVYTVFFTHIEDNTPTGTLGTTAARTNYLVWRDRVIQMAQLARRHNLTWVLQPDWKFLEAARLYEDSATMASTGGVNVLSYVRDTLGTVIDAHAHESGSYNYTDVAHLLGLLGVGGTTVIGGHIWDPSLPQFAHWERFRMPVAGKYFPTASWYGDILMGAGTPNHTNDPIVSGVWRPQDPNNFFVDFPAGNISSIGAYKSDVAGISTLRGLYQSGQVETNCMLTSTFHVTPSMISSAAGLSTVEKDVLLPLKSLQDAGQVVVTDFTSLVATWKSRFASKGCLHKE